MTDAKTEHEEELDAGDDTSSEAAPGTGDVDSSAPGSNVDPADGDEAAGASGPDDAPETPVASESGSGGSETTELVALREEFESLNDRHLRLVAEFNNFRRRSEQERLGAWSRAQADLVGKFLDVLDDLQRVAELDLSNATVEAIMEGIDLVERKFVRVLGDAGAEVLDPTDQTFDPETMEAMMRVPAERDEQVDTVAQVFQKGYALKGTLVRPARVSVYTQS